MRLIAVFNLPVILLALVVGAAAAPSGGSTAGTLPGPKSGLSPFAIVTLFFLLNSTIEGGEVIQIGKPHEGP